jgi:hypothetical protein
MGSDLARGLAERGVVRLLRDVIVPPSPSQLWIGAARESL